MRFGNVQRRAESWPTLGQRRRPDPPDDVFRQPLAPAQSFTSDSASTTG